MLPGAFPGQVAQKMLEIFRGAVALIDEIDWVWSLTSLVGVVIPFPRCQLVPAWLPIKVMHPLKSELHWPCGPVRALDLAEATAPQQFEDRIRTMWKRKGSNVRRNSQLHYMV